MLRGSWNSAPFVWDTERGGRLTGRNICRGGGNRQQSRDVAELAACKGTVLPDATIDAHGVGITRLTVGVAADRMQGMPKYAFMP